MTLYFVPGREAWDPRHGNSCGGEIGGEDSVKVTVEQAGRHCNSVPAHPEVQRLAVWEIVKGNLLEKKVRWTVFAILILTYVHLTEYIFENAGRRFFFFFKNKNWREQFFRC